jgi:hypothetical protein
LSDLKAVDDAKAAPRMALDLLGIETPERM